jgi:hypothetical protein
MQNQIETRRNFWLGVANGIFFFLGETLIDPTLVIAAFISRITQSALWVGFAALTLDYAWFLPQLWVSGYLQSQPHKMPLYRLTSIIRAGSWVILTASIFIIREPGWLLLVFMGMFSLAAIAAGVGGLSFLEIVSKTIPPHERGMFFAMRLTIAGVMGVGASAVVQWALSDQSLLAYPDNFGALFVAATILFFFGWWAFLQVKEPPDPSILPRASFTEQLRRALHFLRADANFRRFLWLRSALMVAGAAVPFYAIYVQRQLGGSLGMIGIYLGAFKIANLVANLYLGRVSARWGYHRLMQIATGAGLLMTVMVLGLVGVAVTRGISGWAAAWWLAPVFAVNGIRESGLGVSGQSLLLEIAPQSERSLYLGFTNTFLGVILLFASLSGVIVETAGFPALLVVTLLAHVAAADAARRLHGTVHRESALAEPT